MLLFLSLLLDIVSLVSDLSFSLFLHFFRLHFRFSLGIIDLLGFRFGFDLFSFLGFGLGILSGFLLLILDLILISFESLSAFLSF